MKVVVKNPKEEAKVCEVAGISEINKLVGNVDEDGNGLNCVGTDTRIGIGQDIDLYCKENAAFNTELASNLWSPGDRVMLCGTVVFAGWDQDNREEDGACSLTQEQIDYCLEFIAKQTD